MKIAVEPLYDTVPITPATENEADVIEEASIASLNTTVIGVTVETAVAYPAGETETIAGAAVSVNVVVPGDEELLPPHAATLTARTKQRTARKIRGLIFVSSLKRLAVSRHWRYSIRICKNCQWCLFSKERPPGLRRGALCSYAAFFFPRLPPRGVFSVFDFSCWSCNAFAAASSSGVITRLNPP